MADVTSVPSFIPFADPANTPAEENVETVEATEKPDASRIEVLSPEAPSIDASDGPQADHTDLAATQARIDDVTPEQAQKEIDDAESVRTAAQAAADRLKPVDGLAVLFSIYDAFGTDRTSAEEHAAVEALRTDLVTKDEASIEARHEDVNHFYSESETFPAKASTEPF
jgi:hypothetical protein